MRTDRSSEIRRVLAVLAVLALSFAGDLRAQETHAVLTGRGAPGCALQIDGSLDFGEVLIGRSEPRSLSFRNASSVYSCEVLSAEIIKPQAAPDDPFPVSRFTLEVAAALPLTLLPLADHIGALIVTYTPGSPDPEAPPDASVADRAELVVRWRTP